MRLSSAIFGKDLYELTLDDLIEFFKSPQEETSVLEFKSGNVELNKVHRAIAAFLNTEGGILVIGSPKEDRLNNRICKGDLTPCKNISSQDALMHSIGANIIPSPSGIRAKTIEWSSGKAYVLEIPQSQTPPHQVSEEGQYYIRLEREAKPAPHGIVEALFQKRQKPKLTGEVRILLSNPYAVTLFFNVGNQSRIHAENISVIIEINGVKKIRGLKNLPGDVEMKNDRVMVSHNLRDTILVKGTSSTFELALTLRHAFVQVWFNVFCKDSELQTYERLFLTDSKSFAVKADHSNDEDESGAIGESLKQFYELRSKQFHAVLSAKHQLISPQSRKAIYDKAVELGIELPESYVEFMAISDGLQGKTSQGNNFDFFPLHKLSMGSLHHTANGLLLPIGRVGSFQLCLDVTNSTDCTFAFLKDGYNSESNLYSDRKSLFDIIDDYLL